MKRKLLIIGMSLIMLCGCSKKSTNTTPFKNLINEYYVTENNVLIQPLDTTVQLHTYNEHYSEKAVKLVSDKIEMYHKLVDSNNYYLDDKGNRIVNLKVINDSYGSNEAIKVDPILIDMINEAKSLMKLSDGYFNMSLGSVIKVYDGMFTNMGYVLNDPSKEVMEEALACVVDLNNLDEVIVVDEANSSVTLNKLDGCNGKVEIQLGAFSKGYIASKLAEELNKLNISYMLDLGSSSILTHFGELDAKKSWGIGVRSQFSLTENQYVVSLPDSYAMSTSGDDQKFYMVEQADGTYLRRHHILNPATGYSENYYRGVSVIAKGLETGVLDVLSTVLYCIEDEATRSKVVKAFEDHYQIEIGYCLTKEVENNQVKLIINQNMISQIPSNYLASNVIEIIVEE